MSKHGKQIRFSTNGNSYIVYLSQVTELLHRGMAQPTILEGLYSGPAERTLAALKCKPVRTSEPVECLTVGDVLQAAGENQGPTARFSFDGRELSRSDVGRLQVWALSDMAQVGERLAREDWPAAVEEPEAAAGVQVSNGSEIIRAFM